MVRYDIYFHLIYDCLQAGPGYQSTSMHPTSLREWTNCPEQLFTGQEKDVCTSVLSSQLPAWRSTSGLEFRGLKGCCKWELKFSVLLLSDTMPLKSDCLIPKATHLALLLSEHIHPKASQGSKWLPEVQKASMQFHKLTKEHLCRTICLSSSPKLRSAC